MKSGISRYLVVLAVIFAVVIIAIPCTAFDMEAYEIAREKSKLPRPSCEEVKFTQLPCSLDDPEIVWKYITAPETTYIQRLALLNRWEEWFPPRFMSRLLEARDLLSNEERLHYWGLKVHPMTMVPRVQPNLSKFSDSQRQRSILGAQWTVPSVESDYPIAWEEECDGPWPWQVQGALDGLLGRCVNKPLNTEQPPDPWWNPWIAEALKIPCRTDREAVFFVEVTRTAISWKYPQVLSRWLDIAENPNFPKGAESVVSVLELDWKEMTTYAMIHEILEKSPHKNEVGQLGYQLRRITESMRNNPDNGSFWMPSSAVLVLSRYANDTKFGNEVERLYGCVYPVCEVVTNPPFKRDNAMDTELTIVAQKLAEFKTWFEKHEASFVAASEKEKQALDAIIEKLKMPK